jgi:predicted GH43/DUF377 family glycosyl hydrolase
MNNDTSTNFVKYALSNGGNIKPLLIKSQDLSGPALTNPSVLVVNGEILVNIRNVNYTLYHSELSKFEHKWGPLSYIHPENDMHLRTTNYIARLNEDLDIVSYSKIDTSKFDTYKPKWEFVGLEDVRLVEWHGKVYGIGVRRDLDTKGTGRMEISELEITDDYVKEISRYRIPGPPPDQEYCMKNCTPLIDKPFHLLKWTNPTAIMKFDMSGRPSEVYETSPYIPMTHDMRGGSQVIPFNDGYLTIIHETSLYKTEQGRKNATYRHRFVFWDKDLKIKQFSPVFSFLNTNIEFCCGMTQHNNDMLITFGAQDNAAYILKISKSAVEKFIHE